MNARVTVEERYSQAQHWMPPVTNCVPVGIPEYLKRVGFGKKVSTSQDNLVISD